MENQAEDTKDSSVCYLSKIPKKMKVLDIRAIFSSYNSERIYLKPKKEIKKKKFQTSYKMKKNEFTEGWIEFEDKAVARSVALTFNGTPVSSKKNSVWGNDLWNIRYLPKFKWDNLVEQFVLDQKIRKQKLTLQINKAKKKKDFFIKNIEQSKSLANVINKKTQAMENNEGINNNESNQNDILKIKRKFIQKKPIN